MKPSRYYIAYCFEANNLRQGFGKIYFTNEKKLSIDTQQDIENLEEWLIDVISEHNKISVKTVTIMDFRKLKEGSLTCQE